MYGGLGDRHSFGLHDTSHYLAPVVAWNLPSDWTLRLSSGLGLNDNSHRFLLRWGVSREFSGFGATIGPACCEAGSWHNEHNENEQDQRHDSGGVNFIAGCYRRLGTEGEFRGNKKG